MTAPTVERSFSIANNQTWEEVFTLVVSGAGNIVAESKVHLEMRPTPDSTDIALRASIEDGRITVLNAEAGAVLMTINAAVMRKIRAGSYVYDLIVERPTGLTYRLFAGSVNLAQGVTELIVTPPAA
jgi:hypothetical protein